MTNSKYRAFIESARDEYSLIVKDQSARIVSRIGFVAQEMKDYQYEVFNEIQNRAIEINNNAECLLEAERELESLTVTAGDAIVSAANDWRYELSFLDDEFVTPVLNELEMIMTIMQTETFDIFALYNPVTELEEAVILLILEAALYSVLFELFVSEIYSDFIVFGLLINESHKELFPFLQSAFDDFRVGGNLIRTSLVDCNE
jgi:hypothetical protein